MQGADTIARELIRRAAGVVVDTRAGDMTFEAIVAWFDQGGVLRIAADERAEVALRGFSAVPGLVDAAARFAPEHDADHQVAAAELILEALAAHKRISGSEELGWTRATGSRR